MLHDRSGVVHLQNLVFFTVLQDKLAKARAELEKLEPEKLKVGLLGLLLLLLLRVTVIRIKDKDKKAGHGPHGLLNLFMPLALVLTINLWTSYIAICHDSCDTVWRYWQT